MRTLFIAAVFFTGNSALAQTSMLDPIPAKTIVRYPEGGGIRLGAGLSSTTQDPTERYCITGGRGSYPVNSNEINFQQVIDNSSLSDALSISAMARFKGLSASASYTHKTELKESDTNIAVSGYFDVREEFVSSDPSLPRLGSTEPTPSFELPRDQITAAFGGNGAGRIVGTALNLSAVDETIGLTKAAQRVLRTQGLQAFRVECGDYFVAGIIWGGKFDGLLTAKDTSRDERTEIAASLKGSYSFSSFSASTNRVAQRLTSDNRLNLRLRSEGSGPNANPLGTSEFMEFVRQFPTTVPSSARPIRIVLQSYASLADYRNYSQQLPLSIDRLVDQYLKLEHLRRNAMDIDDKPDNYVFLGRISQRSVRGHVDVMSTQQRSLSAALTACEKNIDRCVFPSGVPANDYWARLEMPLTLAEFPWVLRIGAIRARIFDSHNAYRALVERQTLCNNPIINPRPPGRPLPLPMPPSVSCPVFNHEFGKVQSAIAEDERCAAWIDQNILPLYIQNRVERWVKDVWMTRAENSDRARSDLSFAQIDEMLRAEYAKENIPYVERLIPINCSWPV